MSCLGAPPSRGKRARCEEGSPEESVEFSVVGFSATRHPGAAPEEQLQSWAGDLCVTVDRFDVRNLLPQWAPPPAQRRWSSLTEEPAALLEQERFGDLRAREEAGVWHSRACARWFPSPVCRCSHTASER